MKPEDIIVTAVVAVILALAVFYVYRAKRRGQACIGCPHAKDCSRACSCKQSNRKK